MFNSLDPDQVQTQGRRRLFESGTAIEDHRCTSSADGTRGRGREGC